MCVHRLAAHCEHVSVGVLFASLRETPPLEVASAIGATLWIPVRKCITTTMVRDFLSKCDWVPRSFLDVPAGISPCSMP